jgi:hypothetical protein
MFPSASCSRIVFRERVQRRIVALSVVMAVATCLPLPSTAQVRNPNAQPQQLSLFRLSGTVAGVRPGMIMYRDVNNKECYAKIDKDTRRVVVTGVAEASALRPGMSVRFHATLSRRGEAEDPIAELTIFSPTAGDVPGVLPDDPNDKNSQMWVAGLIRTVKDDTITVQAGRNTVKAKLAELAKIKLEVSDYSLAQEGDTIKILGKGYQPDKVIAGEIEIQLAKPLAAPEEQKKPRRNARRPRKPEENERQENLFDKNAAGKDSPDE